jgi:phosphoglycolate phosphatase
MTRTRSTAAWRGHPLQAVLFDLDGTLLDTAADITRALNQAFAERGVAGLPVSDVSRMIGRGSPILIERAAVALGITLSSAEHTALLERFFHYSGEADETNESNAKPYTSVPETLRTLYDAGLSTAVVTNKQRRFAVTLLDRLNLAKFVGVVVGGDSCERRKPDPQPLLYACESLGVPVSQTLMVGDSINDVTAARAARIPIVCVPYGYNEGHDPTSLKCDAMIETLADLPALIWTS